MTTNNSHQPEPQMTDTCQPAVEQQDVGIPDAKERQRLNERLKDLAEQAIARSGFALLSQLGKDLGDDLPKLRVLLGNRKLQDLISPLLGTGYEVRPHPRYGSSQLALYRAGAEPTADSPPNAPVEQRFRYHPRFWGAFAVPLRNDRRLLNPNDYRFRDVSRGDEAEPFEVEVAPDFIIESGEVINRDRVIEANVGRWLAEHGWSKTRVSANATKSHQSPPTEDVVAGRRNLLYLVLEALDRRQRQSVSLPLDVVSALLERQL